MYVSSTLHQYAVCNLHVFSSQTKRIKFQTGNVCETNKDQTRKKYLLKSQQLHLRDHESYT